MCAIVIIPGVSSDDSGETEAVVEGVVEWLVEGVVEVEEWWILLDFPLTADK